MLLTYDSEVLHSKNLRGFKEGFSVLLFLLGGLFLNLMLVILLQLMFSMSLGFRVTVRICSSSLAFVVWTGRGLKQRSQ